MPPTMTHGSSASLGMDVMKRISEGALVTAPSEEVARVKNEISENCEELLEVGARIRPLMVGATQVGWVRGLHPQERKMLKRWVREPNDYIALLLEHATSFTSEEVDALQAYEVRSLVEVVRRMSEYDMSLYGYLPAFATTRDSEALWYSKGDTLASFTGKEVVMPDGKKIKLMAPPDHARIWVSLCTYREQARKRMEENMNALFIVRPWAGKAVDPIAADLKNVARSLETDSMEPWQKIVRVKPKVDINDGWGHPGDSLEDLQRELKGMIEGDKHEKLMVAWSQQMEAEAEVKKKEITQKRKERGITEAGVTESPMVILTERQIKERQAALRKGKMPGAVPRPDPSYFENNPVDDQIAKIRKYR